MPDLTDSTRLKKLREYLGYSQRELAQEFHVTSGAIAHWENGVRPIPGPIEKLISIYEESLNLKHETGSLVSNEALQVSRDLFKISLKTLQQEGLRLQEPEQRNLARLVDDYFHETFKRGRVSGSIKTAIARQIIKSLEGSRGLSIKAAQMASFLELGLPPEIPQILGDLQLSGKPLPFAQIQEILKTAYGHPGKIFSKISSEPLSVTSLAQLHRGTLVTGEEIVIKVQHPGIKDVLASQFKKLSLLAYLGSLLGQSATEALEEIQYQVLLELDYEREIRNQERFRNIFSHEPRIVIPKIYRDLCRSNIIVSEFEPGLSFSAFRARANNQEKSKAALLIAYFHGLAIFQNNLLHADPHSGNFLFRGDKVIFLDFGRIIELDPAEAAQERALYLAIFHKNKLQVFKHFKERNLVVEPESFDFEGFWQLILRQQEHHLVDRPFKITKAFVKAGILEARAFKHRKRIRLDKNLLRASLVNASLWSLFADLEAEANWREQSLAILDIGTPKRSHP